MWKISFILTINTSLLIMSAIKDIYSHSFYQQFISTLDTVVPNFDKQRFLDLIYDGEFEGKEWKERMKHTTKVLAEFLPENFADAYVLIQEIINTIRMRNNQTDNLVYIFFPDYIESYGIDYFDESVEALVFVTQFISCEFAVRPFILKYKQDMLAKMLKWSKHKSAKVRRLATEGSRPRLPWAMAIPDLKKDPSPLLPILENLKADPSDSVRRSVANNLNDISKDHPDVVLGIAAKWMNNGKETDAIIKHGLRTLLKKGHLDVLKYYGLESENISISGLTIKESDIKIGGTLEFCFSIQNNNSSTHKVRIEYGIYYMKSNGVPARKVFKISERILAAKEEILIRKKQSFKLITTRKFYAGKHQLSVIINGQEKQIDDFNLLEQQ
jgi:3-methyladenine DNA glycosylase AlkC